MTDDLLTQVKMYVKPIGALENDLIRQMVFECRGLIIQGPLYYYDDHESLSAIIWSKLYG